MRDDMDGIYRTVPLQNIPWNMESPPEILVDLVRSGRVKPCRTIDLGCGAGNYALYLAGAGFDVTGVDISHRAIEIARKTAAEKQIPCTFVVADLIGDLQVIRDTFDFAYDWELLHHIFPEQREHYVRNVHRILRPGGKYLSVCFSERDPQFGGSGKFRRTPLGTTLYFSSEEELRDLFLPSFTIRVLETREIPGKFAPHLAICAFLEKP